jgi:hypothetical protein
MGHREAPHNNQAAQQSAQTPVPHVPEVVPGAGQLATAPDDNDHPLGANVAPSRHSADPSGVSALPTTAGKTNNQKSKTDAASTHLNPGQPDAGTAPPTTAVAEDARRQATLKGGATKDPIAEALPGRIPYHPLADIFPMLDDETVHDLARDLPKNGLLAAIDLYENKILDGRGRYLACILAGIEPRFENYAGSDPLGFVISCNWPRRHLNESQRSMVGARIADQKSGANRHSDGVPIGTAAKLVNVSKRSVARGKKVLRHGSPDLIKAVDAGSIKVSAAAAEIRVAGHAAGGQKSRPKGQSSIPKRRSPLATENERLKVELAIAVQGLRDIKAEFESFRQSAALKFHPPVDPATAPLEASAEAELELPQFLNRSLTEGLSEAERREFVSVTALWQSSELRRALLQGTATVRERFQTMVLGSMEARGD